MAKKYELRTLKSTDLFAVIKLVKKIGLDNVAKAFESENIVQLAKSGDEAQVGMAVVLDIAQVVIDRLNDCEKEIYDLLAQVSNLSAKEIKDLEMDIFVEMLIDLIQKEDFKRAFTKVVSLFK